MPGPASFRSSRFIAGCNSICALKARNHGSATAGIWEVSFRSKKMKPVLLPFSLPKTIESILADLNPEAAYFAEENGKRTGFIFFDLKDTSQIPAVAEPWFLAFNAHIELHPAMNLEDLKKAGPGIEKAVKNYRRVAQAKAA